MAIGEQTYEMQKQEVGAIPPMTLWNRLNDMEPEAMAATIMDLCTRGFITDQQAQAVIGAPGAAAAEPQQPHLVELPDQNGDPFMLAPAEIASLKPHESRNASGVIRKHTWITMRGGSEESGGAEHQVGLTYEETKKRLGLA